MVGLLNETLLLNMIVIRGNSPPTVMSIFDCMEHMSAGGTKDITFIIEQFKGKVAEVDETTQLTDCFLFYDASNVQTDSAIRFAVTIFTYCKNGSKLPVTKSNTVIIIYLWVRTQFTTQDFSKAKVIF